MKIKSKPFLTTAILVITIAVSLFACPVFVNAATNVTTQAYLAINPNPISLGEYTVINAWLQPIPPTASDVFHNFIVTITKPDGTTETRGPLTTNAVGRPILRIHSLNAGLILR